MAIMQFPFIYVNDPLKGRPLFNGKIFVGIPDLDPEDGNGNPINSKQLNVVQEDGTVVPVAQPFILSSGGVPTYNGATVRLDVEGNYSIKILDKNDAQTYYIENVLESENLITDLEAIARSLNVLDSQVIYSTDTTTVLDNVLYIYDAVQQLTYAKPTLNGTGETIISVIGSALTTNAGSYTLSIAATENVTVSVKDFGAVGDGATDDTQAFNNATSYANGKAVFIPTPSASYKISGEVVGDFISETDIAFTGGVLRELTVISPSIKVKVIAKNQPYFAGSPRYMGLADSWYLTIDSGLFEYNAFPFFFVGNDKLTAFGYSSGAGHANSDEIRYCLINQETGENTTGVFYTNTGAVFHTDWLEPYIEEGEFVNFRSVFTVKRVGGVLLTYTNSTIDISGDTYALWGEPLSFNGEWYGSAYRTVGGYPRSFLIKSSDLTQTWNSVALIASNSAREYNETALFSTGVNNLFAVFREDITATRDLCQASSVDGGLNWTPAAGTIVTPIPNVKGTQPNLTELSNGDLMLVAGKRTGASGVGGGGELIDAEDITGIMYWISTDSGATWGAGVQIAPSWSTDCGNPTAKQLRNGKVAIAFYTALGATNGTVGVEPSIIYMEFDPTATKYV